MNNQRIDPKESNGKQNGKENGIGQLKSQIIQPTNVKNGSQALASPGKKATS